MPDRNDHNAADELQGLLDMDCRQFKRGSWRDFTDTVTPESPVVLLWPGREPLRLWAFDDDLESLALGHALLELCGEGQSPKLESVDGHEFVLSPNGPPAERSVPPAPMAPDHVLEAMAEFIQAGGRWDATGCFHRAAAFDPASRTFLRHVEDIGRHNCIDRLAGWGQAQATPLGGLFLFVSARATASLVAKAARAGFAAMVSRSAVTTAGIETAAKAHLSLAGFARTARFTVFTDSNGLFAGADLPKAQVAEDSI